MRGMKAAVAALLSCCLLSAAAMAQNKAVKIGVLDDMSGPYAENTGPGDVAAVKFAIADFGGWRAAQPKFFGDGGIFDQVYSGAQ